MLFAGQIYLPDARYCSLKFIKQLFSGEKKFFYTKDITIVCVPRSTHISLKHVLRMVMERPEIMVYLPDITNVNTKAVDRIFLFNIVNTIDPYFFQKEVER